MVAVLARSHRKTHGKADIAPGSSGALTDGKDKITLAGHRFTDSKTTTGLWLNQQHKAASKRVRLACSHLRLRDPSSRPCIQTARICLERPAFQRYSAHIGLHLTCSPLRASADLCNASALLCSFALCTKLEGLDRAAACCLSVALWCCRAAAPPEIRSACSKILKAVTAY